MSYSLPCRPCSSASRAVTHFLPRAILARKESHGLELPSHIQAIINAFSQFHSWYRQVRLVNFPYGTRGMTAYVDCAVCVKIGRLINGIQLSGILYWPPSHNLLLQGHDYIN